MLFRSLQLDKAISSRRGTAEIQELFERKIFPFPKPVELIRRFIEVSTDENSIVLDFFAGTSPTAQAVFNMNALDGGKRKFILVQMPESCDAESEAKKAGFETIAEIGKERIRRSGEKIAEETSADLDIGFRVFKTDTSNMVDVYYTPDEVNKNSLNLQVENVKDDRSPEDLLFQEIGRAHV